MSFILYELNDIQKLEEYFDYLTSTVKIAADKKIYEKYQRARRKARIARKKTRKGLADVKGYIIPADVTAISEAGIPINLCIASNPAIEKSGDIVYVYLRLASIGSTFSRTFIAVSKLKIKELRGRIKVKAKPLLYGIMPYECVEDPRVDPDRLGLLYHVRALYRTEISRVFTFRSEIVNDKVDKIEVISFYSKKWGDFLLQDYRDTFPLNQDFMIVRPFLKDKGFGLIAVGPRNGTQVDFDDMIVLPELIPLDNEIKTGSNASLKLSANEYLLLYHVVDSHGVYYTYGALFDKNAELLAITEKPIIVPETGLYSGRRPSTVFVCGAILHNDSILLSAGRDDEITVIYEVKKEKIYDSLEYLNG